MIFSLSLLSAAALSLSAAEGRQIYAHYMACWPAGTSAIHHSLGEAHKVRHDSRNLVEAVELEDHPWFVGVQFHPEYKSTVLYPHPLFVAFVKAAIEQSEQSEKQ